MPSLLIVLVAMVVAIMVAIGVALGAGMAVAATATAAKIEATQFSARAYICDEFLCESFYPTTEAYAECPAGKRALGGGVVQSGQPDKLLVNASGPLDATGFTSRTNDGDVAKLWYTAVTNTGPKGSQNDRTLKVFAICSGVSDATIEATEFTVDPFKTGEAYAKCPAGKRALGGGVVQSGGARDLGLNASGPLDATGFTSKTRDGDVATQWYAAVHNEGFGGTTRTFRVFAICSRASEATIEATAFQVNPYTGDHVGEAFARCPAGKRALGGGVVQSGSADTVRVYGGSGPLDATGVTLETNDGDVAKQWYAAVSHSDHTNQQRLFKVFAICE